MSTETTTETAYEYDIFISYASVDRNLVELLVRKLEMDGFRVWFDVKEIVAGLPTIGQLSDGIASSSHVVVCLSDAYIEREFTIFELQTNLSLDPANKANRTIPVKIRPLNRLIPQIIRALNYVDLSDSSKYDTEYQRIKNSIHRNKPSQIKPTQFDRDTLERTCNAPFEDTNKPNVALFQTRLAVEAICKFLYRQQIGKLPNFAFEDLVGSILLIETVPEHVKMSLSVAQKYGNFVVKDRMEDYIITQESIQPGLAALKVLADWTFATYFGQREKKDLWESILAQLPAQRDAQEREIPGTKYILRAQKLSLNSLGPLYAGRNTAFNQAIAVNLVAIAEDNEAVFFEEVGKFIRLNDASIVRPFDAGKVIVNNKRLCLYVILEHVNGASGQDLAERFGALPALAACELCLGLAVSLEGFHSAIPSIVHGDIKPANIIVDRYGGVKVLSIGRKTGITAEDTSSGAAAGKIDSFLFSSPEQLSGAKSLTPKTDIYALRATFFYLLTGEYKSPTPGSELMSHLPSIALEALEKLTNCDSATKARDILVSAHKGLVGRSVNLRTVIDCYGEDRMLPELSLNDPATEVVIEEKPDSSPLIKPKRLNFSLHTEFPIECRNAWPLGEGRILVWETGADTLAILDGSELLWRDSRSIQFRKISCGIGDVLAVTSWEGDIRCFANGKNSSTVNLGGTVGDIQFCNGRWIAGTWKHALVGITMTGDVTTIFNVEKGIFRIAVMDDGERYAVADLGSGISFYSGNVKTAEISPLGNISSMAFAGKHLVVISGQSLITVNWSGTIVARDNLRETSKVRLLPSPYSCNCLLMTEKGNARLIDESGTQQLYFSFPVGHDLLSFCRISRRFILALPGGGCAYWRNGEQQLAWPDAITANLSSDGHFVAVTSQSKVQLYEDPK